MPHSRVFRVDKEVKLKMRSEKNVLTKQSKSNLIYDKYGILELAANATLRRTPKLSKIMRHLCLKLIQYAISLLTFIKQLWEHNNNITFSELIWMEPTDFMSEIIWQKRMQNEENK